MRKVCLTAALLGAFGLCLCGQTTISTPTPDSIDIRLKALEKSAAILKNLKITGYVQAQWQLAQAPGIKSYAGGDFPVLSDNRFMIRRGRIKFTYTEEFYQLVIQPDLNERNITLREIYGVVAEPWLKQFSLTAGMFNRPFS